MKSTKRGDSESLVNPNVYVIIGAARRSDGTLTVNAIMMWLRDRYAMEFMSMERPSGMCRTLATTD